MDRAELGALRDAIDTILTWPDSVRGQIAQWLQTDAAKSQRRRSRSDRLSLVLNGALVSSRASENWRRASRRY